MLNFSKANVVTGWRASRGLSYATDRHFVATFVPKNSGLDLVLFFSKVNVVFWLEFQVVQVGSVSFLILFVYIILHISYLGFTSHQKSFCLAPYFQQ